MFIEGVDGSRYGQCFTFIPLYNDNYRAPEAVDLEFDNDKGIYACVSLYKKDVRRLIDYLTKLEGEME